MTTTKEFVAQFDLIDPGLVEHEINRLIDRHRAETVVARKRPGRIFVVYDGIDIFPLRDEPTVAIIDEDVTHEQLEEIRSTHEIVILVWPACRGTHVMLSETKTPYQIAYGGHSAALADLQHRASEDGAKGVNVGSGIILDLALLRGL